MKDSLVIPIKVIVNQMLNTGIFPNRFKIAKVLPLYKKGEKHILINYRPISLLPSISNFLKKSSTYNYIIILNLIISFLQVGMDFAQNNLQNQLHLKL